MVLRFVLAAYIAALAAMPFAHHDLVCHLKSSTHCATCHVGTSTDPNGAQPALAAADLAYAGQTVDRTWAVAPSSAVTPSAGRAPPVSTPTSAL